MRIIAGTARGRRLAAPQGQATRPTSDRAREAIFNILFQVWDARVLDAFAGSGAMALEALSRGAAQAVLCEVDPAAQQAIRANIQAMGMGDRARLFCQPALEAAAQLAQSGQQFDLVFLDPPYQKGLAVPLLEALRDRRLLAPKARLIWERAAQEDEPPPQGYATLGQRRYGKAAVILLTQET